MKSRLRIKHGVWCCISDDWCMGYGYTPAEAFAEWLERGGIPVPRCAPKRKDETK